MYSEAPYPGATKEYRQQFFMEKKKTTFIWKPSYMQQCSRDIFTILYR